MRLLEGESVCIAGEWSSSAHVSKSPMREARDRIRWTLRVTHWGDGPDAMRNTGAVLVRGLCGTDPAMRLGGLSNLTRRPPSCQRAPMVLHKRPDALDGLRLNVLPLTQPRDECRIIQRLRAEGRMLHSG